MSDFKPAFQLEPTIQFFRSFNAPDGTRLFFRPEAKIRLAPGPRDKLRGKRISTPLRHPLNMLASCRLIKWAHKDFTPIVSRDQIMAHYFGDVPDMSQKRLGVIVNDAVQYSAPYNNNGEHSWRFHHQLDILYGLERQIASWLEPFLRQIEEENFEEFSGPERIDEELDYIKNRTLVEDIELIYEPAVDLSTLWAHSDNPREYAPRVPERVRRARRRNRYTP